MEKLQADDPKVGDNMGFLLMFHWIILLLEDILMKMEQQLYSRETTQNGIRDEMHISCRFQDSIEIIQQCNSSM